MWARPQLSRTIVTRSAWRSQRVGSGTCARSAACGAQDSTRSSGSFFTMADLPGRRWPHGSFASGEIPVSAWVALYRALGYGRSVDDGPWPPGLDAVAPSACAVYPVLTARRGGG